MVVVCCEPSADGPIRVVPSPPVRDGRLCPIANLPAAAEQRMHATPLGGPNLGAIPTAGLMPAGVLLGRGRRRVMPTFGGSVYGLPHSHPACGAMMTAAESSPLCRVGGLRPYARPEAERPLPKVRRRALSRDTGRCNRRRIRTLLRGRRA
jgi:hypothetical protein